jgi:hypothetical protein
MTTVLGGVQHFYKSAATSGDLGSASTCDYLVILISKNGEKSPYKS